MTKLNQLRAFLLVMALCPMLSGCIVDDIPPKEDKPVNEWIEETMRKYYLWEDEIAGQEALDLSADPETFFQSMLSDKDGKVGKGYHYSTINKKSSSTKANMGDGYSFGFEYQYYIIEKMNKYALLILYVLPGSPADDRGFKRGDWIMDINNKEVPRTTAELIRLMDVSSAVTATFGISNDPGEAVRDRLDLTASLVTDNPVFVNKTILYGNPQRKIAYLVYNHFTSGPTGATNDEQFSNRLRDAFANFKAEKPDEFILDLRYNGGGELVASQLLGTMLAPESALGEIFCNQVYNEKQKGSNKPVLLDTKNIKEGANLDLKKLYIITSKRTASASEAIINGLSPFLGLNTKLILVGEKTEGKNVGSLAFKDENYDWEIHPIIIRLSNSEGFSDYDTGFEPTFQCEEGSNVQYDLGDTREYLLRKVLDYIVAGSPIRATSLRSTDEFNLVPIYNSLDGKKRNEMVIR